MLILILKKKIKKLKTISYVYFEKATSRGRVIWASILVGCGCAAFIYVLRVRVFKSKSGPGWDNRDMVF